MQKVLEMIRDLRKDCADSGRPPPEAREQRGRGMGGRDRDGQPLLISFRYTGLIERRTCPTHGGWPIEPEQGFEDF